MCAAPVQDFQIAGVTVHELYDIPKYRNDIALIRLQGEANLNGEHATKKSPIISFVKDWCFQSWIGMRKQSLLTMVLENFGKYCFDSLRIRNESSTEHFQKILLKFSSRKLLDCLLFPNRNACSKATHFLSKFASTERLKCTANCFYDRASGSLNNQWFRHLSRDKRTSIK